MNPVELGLLMLATVVPRITFVPAVCSWVAEVSR